MEGNTNLTDEKLDRKFGKATLLHTTGKSTSVNVTTDLTQYKLLSLTLGAGVGAYGIIDIPTALIVDNIKTTFNVTAFGGSGQVVAKGSLVYNSTTKTISTTDTNYPAILIGIK